MRIPEGPDGMASKPVDHNATVTKMVQEPFIRNHMLQDPEIREGIRHLLCGAPVLVLKR